MRVIHCLNWKLNDIDVERIAQQGFTHVQIGPLQPTKTEENRWFWLYQPTDMCVGNRLGNFEEFKELCNRAHKAGVKVIVDVVVEHVAGLDDGRLYPHEKVNNELVSKREYLLDPITGCNPDHDRWQCCNRCYGMPRLNYYNEEVVNKIERFLTTVLAYADGIRLDMAKHIALPNEGGHLFWKMIKSLNRNESYGELINVSKGLMNDYAGYIKCLVMDYEATIEHRNMVVCFETHDTFDSFGYTKNMSDNERINRYRNIVNRFENTLYFPRPFEDLVWSEEIKKINRG